MDPPAYAEAIRAARKLFDFAENVGYRCNLLDIGGGFPGDNNTDITEVVLNFLFYFSSIVNLINLIMIYFLNGRLHP